MKSEPTHRPDTHTHLRIVNWKGSIMLWGTAGTLLALAGLFLLTGWSFSPWLFLLYPALIGLLLVSLGALGLHLLHRF